VGIFIFLSHLFPQDFLLFPEREHRGERGETPVFIVYFEDGTFNFSQRPNRLFRCRKVGECGRMWINVEEVEGLCS
jgi:hypothetical protein